MTYDHIRTEAGGGAVLVGRRELYLSCGLKDWGEGSAELEDAGSGGKVS